MTRLLDVRKKYKDSEMKYYSCNKSFKQKINSSPYIYYKIHSCIVSRAENMLYLY